MSKGSSPRPFSVTQQEYDQRWDAIFNRPTQQELDDARAEDEAFQKVSEAALNAYNDERLVSKMDKIQMGRE